ncbi:hypothetical protein ACHAQH_009008 [Verticillium albo-atrum]
MDEGRLLPVEATDAKSILDVGTGTGDWALVWFDWDKMFKVLTDANGLDVDLYENNRAQSELEKLGLEFLFYSSRKHSVGYKTHIYDDRSVLVCAVEQMKGVLALAMEVVPWHANLGDLMHRLETEIFDKGIVIEV